VIVPRGPSLASCSAAIVAAIEADAEARQERRGSRSAAPVEEASRAVMRRPLSIALVERRR
jgi:hypothetical protein